MRQIVGWALVASGFLVSVLPFAIPTLTWLAPALQLAVLLTFAWVHGMARYGWRGMALFMVSVAAIASAFECLSIHIGFPFGWFEHQPAMGPQFLGVPLIIGPGYFAVGYPAWIVAALLLGAADRDGRASSIPALALVSALVVTGYDAVVDPAGATLRHSWIYRDGGGYYGVPLSNFGGWLLTTAAAYLAAGWLMLRRGGALPPIPQTPGWWLQAPVMLASQVLPAPLALALSPQANGRDATGQVWNSAHLFEGTTVVAVVSTLAFIATACLLALRQHGTRF